MSNSFLELENLCDISHFMRAALEFLPDPVIIHGHDNSVTFEWSYREQKVGLCFGENPHWYWVNPYIMKSGHLDPDMPERLLISLEGFSCSKCAASCGC